jgi:imidazolonepropionase-like amidohydrolase
VRRALLLLFVGCHHPAPTVHATAAIVDVTVVPMDAERELAHQTVLVDGDHIVAVGPVASTPVAKGVPTIDGKGRWLIPGLYDMHVHLNEANDALLYVANGVTTVRNMWGGPEQLAWREQARKNDPAWLGPAIVTAGPIVDGDPPVWPGSKVVTTPEAAVAEVDAQKQAGYDFVKVYEELSIPVYDAIAAEAKKQQIRFAGHVPVAVGLEHALASGQASIEHLTGYLGAASGMPQANLAEILAHVDATKLPALAKATHAAGTANTPTLIVMERIAALSDPAPLIARPENRFISPQTRDGWNPANDFRFHDKTPDDFAAMRAASTVRTHIVKALSDEGATLFAGTDAPNPYVFPGFSLHEELGLLVGAGLTPYQALRAATAVPAQWLGRTATITVGAPADLVLLAGDPLKDIAATRTRAGVMLRGTWVPQAALDSKLEALATSYAHPTDPLASAPPLDLANPAATASYTMTMRGHVIGRERLAVAAKAGGGRVIVAQGYAQPATTVTTVRIELDAAGHETALVVDGKDTKPTGDELLDVNLLATMIPFADRALAAHAKTAVRGKIVDPGGALEDIAYTFEPDVSGIWRFSVTSKLGTAPGTYAVDKNGLPTRVTLQVGGELSITRD